jgi:hypothetical protein
VRVGVAVGEGVAVGVGEKVAVAVADGVRELVALGVTVAVSVTVGVGVPNSGPAPRDRYTMAPSAASRMSTSSASSNFFIG